jgi:competence protein ComEC
MAGFVAGALWLQTQAALPPRPAIALAGVSLLAALLAWLFHGRPGTGRVDWPRHCASATCGLATGFFWAALLASRSLSHELAQADEGHDITITGTIASLPNRSAQGVRFHVDVEQASGNRAAIPPRIALSWFAGYRGEAEPVGDVRPGERWQLTVRLQRPHGNANPHGFDYELWLLEQGIRATGYVRQQGSNRRLAASVPGFGYRVESARAALRDRIMRALPEQDYAGVIVALVIGDQRAISQSDWEVFNGTGIAHLVSISGLHITMIAGLVAWGAAALWRRSFFTQAQLPLLLPAQKVAAVAGLLAAFAYVLLAGFGVPAQRTLYMLAVIAVALWLDRLAGITHVLCLAAFVTVLLDPWAVMWPGFWLSFGAVAAILYATAGRPGRPYAMAIAGDLNMQLTNNDGATATPATSGGGWARGEPGGRSRRWCAGALGGLKLAAHVQYAVTVGLVPLTMLLFAQFSLASPIANAIAIPVISLFVTPLALIGSLLPEAAGNPLLQLAHGAVWLLAQALHWISAWPHAVWSAPAPPAWAFIWASIGTAWMLAPRGWPVRWLGLATWLPLLLARPDHPPSGQFRVIAFDVGQGMALLVETAGRRLLYDTGPAYTVESNGGNRVILPYLKARGIAHLDGMVVSHSDTDHAGGALAVLQGRDVGWMASSLHSHHPLALAARRHVPCTAGQHWRWDGVDFMFLHPAAGSYGDSALKPNARSCVLKISAGGKAVILAGDIEAAQEAQLLAGASSNLRADVLLAPHHGSGTSSTEAFLRAVGPSVALFQVGHRNRYHHPQAQVWARYGALGIRSLRTDELGAITVSVGGAVAWESYRQAHARYWYGR